MNKEILDTDVKYYVVLAIWQSFISSKTYEEVSICRTKETAETVANNYQVFFDAKTTIYETGNFVEDVLEFIGNEPNDWSE